MHAQSISIQVSDRTKCTGHCPFCIARTTPGSIVDTDRIEQCDKFALRRGLNYANKLGATHAILTSKADPLQESDTYLLDLIKIAREYLPLCDIHTNGIPLHQGVGKERFLSDAVKAGLTMITFSIASMNPVNNQRIMGKAVGNMNELIPIAVDLGLLVRCSLVIYKRGVSDQTGIIDYIRAVGNLGAHSVVIREIWVPEAYGRFNEAVYRHNQENQIKIKPIEEAFIEDAKNTSCYSYISQRDPLPWGTPVFAAQEMFNDPDHGVQVTFARCDEATSGPVIKSIVHKPNGHGYRNWDSNGDILY